MSEKKNKYTNPKIVAVDLESSQAILQVCMVGGEYLDLGGGRCRAQYTTRSRYCTLTPKGA
ncbi:MAG: hypothetical protein PHQ52_08290, partial [Candidatus Omnitrophica bacterium]|nr:hypothetical protein [Candidatus Omnitrophota bacterium]